MADYSQTCFFVTSRKEGSFRVKPGDKSCDVPAFVSLTNFILILTPVAPLQRSCGGTGLTGIRISTLSTFIHSGCGACRETFAKYHGIDCRSFLSERNATNRAHRASVYSSLTQSMRVCVRACDCMRYWCICSRLDEISVSPIYRRCRVIRNFKIPPTICRIGYVTSRTYVSSTTDMRKILAQGSRFNLQQRLWETISYRIQFSD